MLEQAEGVSLRMTLTDLTRVRLKVITDENGVWEGVDAVHTNTYMFGSGSVLGE